VNKFLSYRVLREHTPFAVGKNFFVAIVQNCDGLASGFGVKRMLGCIRESTSTIQIT
jgi:hypothetical protein